MPSQKKNAYQAVYQAIKKGRLRPASAYTCHDCPAPAVEYHHYRGYKRENYYDVIPLCVRCHNQHHLPDERRRKVGNSY